MDAAAPAWKTRRLLRFLEDLAELEDDEDTVLANAAPESDSSL